MRLHLTIATCMAVAILGFGSGTALAQRAVIFDFETAPGTIEAQANVSTRSARSGGS